MSAQPIPESGATPAPYTRLSDHEFRQLGLLLQRCYETEPASLEYLFTSICGLPDPPLDEGWAWAAAECLAKAERDRG